MNYQIIADETALCQFINWLPELEDHETYYVCLFSRSKYCTGITHVRSDKAQLKRFTAHKGNLLQKIKQLECGIGNYTVKDIIAPQESLAIYISPNPRSLKQASLTGLKKLADLITKDYNGYNPHQEIMSEIQKAKSRTVFVDFDFDCDKRVYSEIEDQIFNIINKEAVNILHTRGGFHLLVEPKKITINLNKWYIRICELLKMYSSDNDNKGDNMIPIPGCFQGGFIPKLINS